MSNHIKIDEDFVASLLATAKWDHPLQLQEEVQEEEVIVEEHTCPLCESELDEELSDETILEHLDAIQDILTEKKNDVADDDEDEDGVDEQEEEPEEEEEEEEAPEVNASKKAKVKKKVKELKEKWAGEKNGDDSKEDDSKEDDDDKGDPKAFGGKKGDKSKTKKGKDFEKKG